MSTMSRTRGALVGLSALAVLSLGGPAAVAAPYTGGAVIEVSTTNPRVAATIKIFLSGFAGGEVITIILHSTTLATVTAGPDGSVSTTVKLPADFMCEHPLIASGNAGNEATIPLLIGPPEACPGHGGNTGNGNTGENNTGNGNTGNGNTGNGNTGDGNTGDGNTSDGNTGWGNVNYAQATPTTAATEDDRASSFLALAAFLGVTAVGGIGLARRRRQGY